MKPITKNLKSILHELLYDQKVVNDIRKANVNKDHLHNLLTMGRITLEEYVRAVK